jgi:hypothetical protein
MPLSTIIRPPRRRAALAVLASAAFLSTAWPAAASADDQVVATTRSGVDILETPETRETCTAPQIASPFSTLGDDRDYVLAPGGSFEDKTLDGWQVAKSRQDGDHSSFRLNYAGDNKHSLRVPAGGSAVSPAMCVDLHYPTLRFMAKPESNRGTLKIEVAYPDSPDPVFHEAGEVDATPNKKWGLTSDIPVYPERGGAAPGMRRVALRFTSTASDGETPGDWKIDDLYVDPKRL